MLMDSEHINWIDNKPKSNTKDLGIIQNEIYQTTGVPKEMLDNVSAASTDVHDTLFNRMVEKQNVQIKNILQKVLLKYNLFLHLRNRPYHERFLQRSHLPFHEGLSCSLIFFQYF